ncbi:MAG: ABC transporter ATP-binding protein [Gemmatimonadota bacterium]
MRGAPEFRARGVTFRYPRSARPALDGVDFHAPAGVLSTVIGPNGSGKSTLLRVLLGAHVPTTGEVTFAGASVPAWDRRALARRVGVVPQSETVAFPMRVRDYVAMGRYPHVGPWRPMADSDHAAVSDAMARCDAGAFADRLLSTLSGGEMQRVRIARALAQEPEALVLDEPTAALDVRHEMAIFSLLLGLAREGRAVVLVTHSLNLSGRFADRVLLLDRGRPRAEGPPGDVLRQEHIERVYEWPVRITTHPGPGRDQGAPQVVPLRRPIRPGPQPIPPA